MARIDFINELKELGYTPVELGGNKLTIEYQASVGKNIGKKVWLGLEVDDSFPMNCPTGPHFKSISDGWINPDNQIINHNNFGTEWHYWSRPFADWNRTNHSVKAYFGHLRNLLFHL
jgi:hypothetical protein